MWRGPARLSPAKPGPAIGGGTLLPYSLNPGPSPLFFHTPQVRVPQPVNELCSRDVLVMEYLDGVKLVDAIRDFYVRVAQSRCVTPCASCAQERVSSAEVVLTFCLRPSRRNMTLDELQEEYRRLGKTPPPEWKMTQYEWMEWGKAKAYNSLAATYNWTLGWVAPNLEYAAPGELEKDRHGLVSTFS